MYNDPFGVPFGGPYSDPMRADQRSFVNFGQAIGAFFKNYVNFRGSACRSEFWFALLFCLSVSLAVSGAEFAEGGKGIISALWALAVLVPSLSLQVRRLHDTGRSWYCILMYLIPIAGIVFFILWNCEKSMKKIYFVGDTLGSFEDRPDRAGTRKGRADNPWAGLNKYPDNDTSDDPAGEGRSHAANPWRVAAGPEQDCPDEAGDEPSPYWPDDPWGDPSSPLHGKSSGRKEADGQEIEELIWKAVFPQKAGRYACNPVRGTLMDAGLSRAEEDRIRERINDLQTEVACSVSAASVTGRQCLSCRKDCEHARNGSHAAAGEMKAANDRIPKKVKDRVDDMIRSALFWNQRGYTGNELWSIERALYYIFGYDWYSPDLILPERPEDTCPPAADGADPEEVRRQRTEYLETKVVRGCCRNSVLLTMMPISRGICLSCREKCEHAWNGRHLTPEEMEAVNALIPQDIRERVDRMIEEKYRGQQGRGLCFKIWSSQRYCYYEYGYDWYSPELTHPEILFD